MLRLGILAIPLLAVVGGLAHAEDVGFAGLERALPAGWTMLTTDSELVLRHDRPCFHSGDKPADGALVTLELRYHLEPKWTPVQHAHATQANDAIAADLRAARDRFKIDSIHLVKGTYLPGNADERARLAEFKKVEDQAHRKAVRAPMCALGDQSLFDGDETYAGMKQPIDPPEALAEARAVIALVKQHCGGR